MSCGGGLDLDLVRPLRRRWEVAVGAGDCALDAESTLLMVVGVVASNVEGGIGWGSSLRICLKDMAAWVSGGNGTRRESTRAASGEDCYVFLRVLRFQARRPQDDDNVYTSTFYTRRSGVADGGVRCATLRGRRRVWPAGELDR